MCDGRYKSLRGTSNSVLQERDSIVDALGLGQDQVAEGPEFAPSQAKARVRSERSRESNSAWWPESHALRKCAVKQ
jgi:hypothetical protein